MCRRLGTVTMGAGHSKEKKDKKKDKQKEKRKISAPAVQTTTMLQNNKNQHTTVQQTYYKTTTVRHESSTDSRIIAQASTSAFPHHTISASSNINRKFSVPALVDPLPSTISKITVPLRPQIPSFRGTAARGPLARSITSTQQTDLPLPRQRLPTVPLPQTENQENPILNIRIKKCLRVINPKNSHVPTYATYGRRRGLSLIINNVNFEKPRRGGDADGQNMFNLLSGLKLQPKLLKNMKVKEMAWALEKFSKNSDLADVDMCVVVIMSHGSGSMDTTTEIFGVDENAMKVTEIISMFSKERCRYLSDKPKVFIFQCCRGNQELVIETDAVVARPPHCADMLLCYATISGFVAYRNVDLGSYYIREICKVFSENAHDTHVEDMLKKVQDNIRRGETNQLATFENLSFNSCYLNPI